MDELETEVAKAVKAVVPGEAVAAVDGIKVVD